MNANKNNLNNKAWEEIYKTNYGFFRKYFEKKFLLSREDIEDYYHEAFIIFLKNVQKDNFNVPADMVKWFLIKIARYKLLNNYRRLKIGQQVQEEQFHQQRLENNNQQVAFVGKQETMEELITYLFNRLDETAKMLIDLRYLQEYCHEGIAREMNYQNTAVSKSRLSNVLKKIRANESLLGELKLILY